MTTLHTLSQTVRALGLCAALSLAGTAQAALVRYDFSVTIDFSAAPQVNFGDIFSGYYSYDDSVFTIDPGFPGEKHFPLTAFHFNFANTSYSLANLSVSDAVQDGAAFAGLDVAGPTFSFLPDASAPWFAFQIGQFGGTGSVVNRLDVPEPGSLVLAAAALAALGLRRRATRG